MDKRPPDENLEWKSIRSELCGMLEAQLDEEGAEPTQPCQYGRGYVRLRVGVALSESTGGLLHLKHQEKIRRAHLGPFDRGCTSHHSHAACASPCCSSLGDLATEPPASEDLGSNGQGTPPNGRRPRANGPHHQALRSLQR